MKDLTIYKDTKRNEKCPCGSGNIFKKCCMEEYRKSKRSSKSIKLVPLTIDEKESFEELFRDLLIFTSFYKKRLGIKEDIDISMSEELMKDRRFFYKNRKDILATYREEKILLKKDKEILDIIENARFEKFLVSSYDNNYAVIVDTSNNVYLIEAIDLPLVCSFRHEQDDYAYIETALIRYKNRYISDGIFEHFKFSLDENIKKQVKVIIRKANVY